MSSTKESEKDRKPAGLKKDKDDEETEEELEDDKKGDEPQSPSSTGNQDPELRWETYFDKLVEFKKKSGHCYVPYRYAEDPKLGKWVSAQRNYYRKLQKGESSVLTADRAKRLEEVGFAWATTNPRHVPWEQRFGELMEFVEKYGHSQVPIGWEDNVQLSHWVSTQRQEYKLMQKGRKTRLTPERIEKLNQAHFIWEAQRGGPRRQRRATLSVPPTATPAKPKVNADGNPVRTSGRGGSLAASARMAMTDRRHSHPADMKMGDDDESPDADADRRKAASGLAAMTGAVLDPAAAAAHARSMQGAGMMPPFTMAGIPGLGGGMMGSSWTGVPGPSQAAGQNFKLPPHLEGCVLIDTPIPIAAAGYQLGMIPITMLQRVGTSGSAFPAAAAAPAASGEKGDKAEKAAVAPKRKKSVTIKKSPAKRTRRDASSGSEDENGSDSDLEKDAKKKAAGDKKKKK